YGVVFATTALPSGAKATAPTQPSLASGSATGMVRSNLPSADRQIRNVRSSEPEATSLPSGDTATATTKVLCPPHLISLTSWLRLVETIASRATMDNEVMATKVERWFI